MKKILLIDDDSDILEILKYRLVANDFEVRCVTSATEAISEAENRPDLIILDIMMPSNGEGLSLFSKLRIDEITKDIPVIFLSRKVEEREKTLKMGANYFIEKPFDAKELLDKIHLALEGKRESVPEE